MLYRQISAFFFFYFSTIATYVIFMPKVLSDLGYSSAQIGIIFAIAPLMRFITPFLFLNRFELNRGVFKSSLILSFISVILFSFAIYNFYLFLITNIFFGISLSLTLPYVESLAIEKLKENYGKSRLFGSIGFMILVLILGEFLTSEMVAIWFLLISVGATLLFGFTIEYEIVKEKLHIEQFSIKGRLKFWISLFLMQFSFGAFYNFFVIYASERAISITMSSYLWTFSVVCEILMFTFQAPIFKRFKTLDIIKFTIIITSFRWFLFFMFDSNLYIYLFAQFLHIFSFALYHSAVITYLHKIYSNKRLAQQFFYGISYGLGGFLGAIFAGVVYGEYLFLYSSLIAMLGFIVILKEDRES